MLTQRHFKIIINVFISCEARLMKPQIQKFKVFQNLEIEDNNITKK